MSALIKSDLAPATPVAPPLPTPAAQRHFTARLHETIGSIAPVWTRLQQDGTCTAYQRLEWAELIVTHLTGPKAVRPLFVEIVDSRTQYPAMILPLAYRRLRTHSELSWLNVGVCDYTAPVMADGLALSAEEMRQAWQAALAVLPRADFLLIPQMRETVFGKANPLLHLDGIRKMELQSFGVALEGDAATLLQRLMKSTARSDLKRRTNKLAAISAPQFVAAETPQVLEEIFAVMMHQRRERFRDMGRADLLNQPEVEAFYLDAARRGLIDGMTRVFGIKVNDVWIATSLGIVHSGAFHGIILAMSSEWKSYSPGLMMATQCMVWSRSIGLDYFDLTVGALAYKGAIGGQAFDLYELSEAISLRGRIVQQGRHSAEQAKAWLKRNPKLFEPLRALRRALRRWQIPGFRN